MSALPRMVVAGRVAGPPRAQTRLVVLMLERLLVEPGTARRALKATGASKLRPRRGAWRWAVRTQDSTWVPAHPGLQQVGDVQAHVHVALGQPPVKPHKRRVVKAGAGGEVVPAAVAGHQGRVGHPVLGRVVQALQPEPLVQALGVAQAVGQGLVVGVDVADDVRAVVAAAVVDELQSGWPRGAAGTRRSARGCRGGRWRSCPGRSPPGPPRRPGGGCRCRAGGRASAPGAPPGAGPCRRPRCCPGWPSGRPRPWRAGRGAGRPGRRPWPGRTGAPRPRGPSWAQRPKRSSSSRVMGRAWPRAPAAARPAMRWASTRCWERSLLSSQTVPSFTRASVPASLTSSSYSVPLTAATVSGVKTSKRLLSASFCTLALKRPFSRSKTLPRLAPSWLSSRTVMSVLGPRWVLEPSSRRGRPGCPPR